MPLARFRSSLRSLMPPPRTWLLLFPLAFYLTRGVRVWNPENLLEYQRVSLQAFNADCLAHRLEFVCYLAFGLPLDGLQYQMVQGAATACLFVGGAAWAKAIRARWKASALLRP